MKKTFSYTSRGANISPISRYFCHAIILSQRAFSLIHRLRPRNLYYWVPAILTAIIPGIVFGAPTTGGSVQIQNPLNSNLSTVPAFMAAILDIVVKIGAPIAVLMVVYSGFLFVTARGSDEGLTKAKKALVWTIIGTMILLGAQIIANVISTTIDEITP